MVAILSMRNIHGIHTRHMAGRAIVLFAVMLCCEGRAMTRQTFRPVIHGSLRGFWRRVRVMACDTGHSVAGRPFAGALRQRFKLADGAHVFFSVSGQNLIVHELRKIVARAKLIQVASWLFDRRVTFQMALHTNSVAPGGA